MSIIEVDKARLRHLADTLEWAQGDPPDVWSYESDADPQSIYAEWVRATGPEVVVALLDELDARGGKG